MNAQSPTITYLKDYLPADFIIETVHLHFDIFDDHTAIKTLLDMRRNLKANTPKAPLKLDGEDLTLESVFIDGKELSKNDYEITDSHLIIEIVPDSFLLETRVVMYPKKNTQLMGLYQSRDNLCTQCESEGFRRITYFLDRPDVMSHFTTTITADKNKYPMLLSNGNLVEEKMLDEHRHWVHWEDPSLKPCYLFALVAGDFDLIEDTFKTMSGREIALRLYLEKGFLDQGAYAMESLKQAMRWDEERFGREYDLDIYMIVAVSDFNMGAMENKGLNIFNTKYVLAKPKTATDDDYMHIESVIGHEYFHNWSGNRVTCRDWFQLTLKEGLTVFRDQLFTEDRTSQGVARIDVVNVLRNHQFPEDAGPMAHPIRPQSYIKMDNFYTTTVYNKGAEVIRMVRTLLTPEGFRKGMDLYFKRYDGQAVTTDDFIQVMSDVSGKDFSQFLRWYEQAGTPMLIVKSRYDEKQKTLVLNVKQSCPPTPNQSDKKPFHFPLAVGLVGESCVDLDLQLQNETTVAHGTKILDITKPEEEFTFINVNEYAVPSLLRHFSAPVELQYDYTNEQLALLWQCDSDPFCQWEAGQRLAVNVIGTIASDLSADKKPTVDPIFIQSVEKLLSDPIDDSSLLARLLTLPSLKFLLTHLPTFDLDILFAAKELLEKSVATQLEKMWLATFEKHQISGEYVYELSDCGHRNLKNQCLYYLLKTEKEDYFHLADQQFMQANNLTDELGALHALNSHAIAQREKALAHFYEIYQYEPLVVNKWLALQAGASVPTVLEDVKKLVKHPAYDTSNPNNMYALLVTLGENTLRFNNKNGEGYKFLADQIMQIDAKNPQVAARVAQPLTRWERMDKTRGALMKKQLKRMLASKKLSENLFEIVTKSLNAN